MKKMTIHVPTPFTSLGNIPEGLVVGSYHAHTSDNSFSDAYSTIKVGDSTIKGGDELWVKTYKMPLYLGRESMVPFSRKTVVEVMELDSRGKIKTRKLGSYEWNYE